MKDAGNRFEKKYELEIPELDTTAIGYTHKPTNSDVLFLKNRDNNKVFGINFRTPPSDNTGLPHILEHSVLCGSRKYPVKEPFVELLKGSLQTFLNAFTYPDKTCYPVASTHYKDFHNLMDVYLDAVFFPKLTKEIFMQEGWHYHLERPDDPLEIRGVVYNEMKGAYSSPERLLVETVQQSLFPQHPYGFDSGGNPEAIPYLTYEAFRNFHKTYYHPSNARIFFYGDINISDELQLLDTYLRHFNYQKVDSEIPPITPFKEFKRIERKYASTESSSDGGKTFATLNWLFTESSNVELNFAFQILHYILLGMPGSPLRRALIESGLGEDIAGVGLETELRYLYFSTGLKGMKAEAVDSMVGLIEDTLTNLVKKGIPASTIEAAINTIEFRYRELNTGSFPRGLVLMLHALTTWLYGHDPLLLIAFEKPLETIKKKVQENRFYFSEQIERYLLGNLHKTLVVLHPDPGLGSVKETKMRAMLDSIKKSWSEKEIKDVVDTTLRLQKLQAEPDRPEDLAKIPRLSRADLDLAVPEVPVDIEEDSKRRTTVFLHPLETHGIAYIDVGFAFDCIPQDKLPLLPIFCTALLEMGTEKEDYVSFSERISQKTGGIRPKILTRNCFNNKPGVFALFLRGKALRSQIEELTSILKDMITGAVFDSKDRLYQIILKHKAMRYHRLVPEGHRMVLRRINAHFTLSGRVKEILSGLNQYFYLKKLSENFDTEWEKVREDLYFIKKQLFQRADRILNVTADSSLTDYALKSAETLLNDLDMESSDSVALNSWDLSINNKVEGFVLPVQVHYVGVGGPVSFNAGDVPGAFLVVLNLLRTLWLWEKVRVQGGAYGAHCFFDRAAKVLVMTSYRDPHLTETVSVFKDSAQYLNSVSLTDEEITKNIIGAYGKLDPPMFPDGKAYVSMIRYMTGENRTIREMLRKGIVNTSMRDILDIAYMLDEWAKTDVVKVIGPESTLSKAKEEKWPTMNMRVLD